MLVLESKMYILRICEIWKQMLTDDLRKKLTELEEECAKPIETNPKRLAA